ncbi:MAG: AAA family ATPase, partial [Gammaproteobacteria bacterium]|nr:AAA family ATPase [Gammaproteobacteria bacterium]
MSAASVFRYEPDASLAALSLEADPFPPGPGDGYFFVTPALGVIVEQLREFVEHGSGIAVVCGPPGAGKTCLLDQLEHERRPEWRVCRVQGAPETAPAALVDELVHSLGLEARTADHTARAELLRTRLAALREDDRRVLIAVDDADRLPADSRALLMDLAGPPADARLLLTAASSSPALTRDGAAQHAVQLLELAPFTREEAGEYLRSRLKFAGFAGKPPFGDDAVRHIHARSGGVPGAMHPLASQALASRARGRRGIGGAARGRSLRLVAGLVLAGVAIGVLLSRLPGPSDGDSAAAPAVADAGAAPRAGEAATAQE